MKGWKYWDWLGYACLAIAAIIPALNAALNDAPLLKANIPQFPGRAIWPYAPLFLFVVGTIILFFRRFREANKSVDQSRKPWAQSIPILPGNRPLDFQLIPLHFTVELAAQLPFVEVRFYALNFLSLSLAISQVKLSLRLLSSITLELIPLVQDDFQVNPKVASIIICRRNLSDSEIRLIPAKTIRETSSFELLAKASNGERSYAYGPVSSMVIDGWINSPPLPHKTSFEFVSLRDVAVQFFERDTTSNRALAHGAEKLAGKNFGMASPEERLDWMATYISQKVAIYGKCPPSTKLMEISNSTIKQSYFSDGATYLRDRFYDKSNFYIDLAVRRDEIEKLLS